MTKPEEDVTRELLASEGRACSASSRPLHPSTSALLDAIQAVQQRFAQATPPVCAVHLSSPKRPQLEFHTIRVWFLVQGQTELAAAAAAGLLAEIEAALTEELTLRSHPDRDFGTLVVALASLQEHDPTSCLRHVRSPGAPQ